MILYLTFFYNFTNKKEIVKSFRKANKNIYNDIYLLLFKYSYTSFETIKIGIDKMIPKIPNKELKTIIPIILKIGLIPLLFLNIKGLII